MSTLYKFSVFWSRQGVKNVALTQIGTLHKPYFFYNNKLDRSCSLCHQIHTTSLNHQSPKLSHKEIMKLKRLKWQRKEKQKLEEKLKIITESATPSIIKMVMQNNEKTGSNNGNKDTVKDEFSEKIRELDWDFKAVKEKSKLMLKQRVSLDQLDADTSFDTTADSIHTNTVKRKKRVLKPFGTPDPSVPLTDIPCVGCGAKLHCTDTGIPGYIPSEKFKSSTFAELKKSLCHKCFLVQNHNFCLNIKATENEFEKIIYRIKYDRALVLVLIDVTDIENSIIKGLTKIIGNRRPLCIIGNKVDLIPKDGSGYLERIQKAMMDACVKHGLVNDLGTNIKHVHLISAKTGYGVESLITQLMKKWKLEGEVYLVGNTNAGKSTLFNSLLMSDYCKSGVSEAINRATVSIWPGTTLNLLKFPIVNPTSWRLQKRSDRLIKQRTQEQEEKSLERSRKTSSKEAWKFNTLKDFRSQKAKDIEEKELDLVQGYDIPSFEVIDGVVINFLEQDELVSVIPTSIVVPRIFVLKQGSVMFISGLSRIDYIEGDHPAYISVFTSKEIKVHIVPDNEADDFYKQNIGTNVFGVPLGNQERLEKIPSLVGREFHVSGIHWKTTAADIQISSLGWFSVTLGNNLKACLRVYTPGGRGMYIREPSILPNFATFMGKRIRGTKKITTRNPKIKGEHFK
ncbi:hypothetical protein KUTeg_005290 [Tegillarca granosa]|uniref:Nitric oxide-associated protein 1 n=1 Tax=Tegillarca granosa TaxID=220873 RepID=A0ABQ9FL14_TEGGR|nr:hypothetical protein KUTeg_005290 [Tegillarca granosa]